MTASEIRSSSINKVRLCFQGACIFPDGLCTSWFLTDGKKVGLDHTIFISFPCVRTVNLP